MRPRCPTAVRRSSLLRIVAILTFAAFLVQSGCIARMAAAPADPPTHTAALSNTNPNLRLSRRTQPKSGARTPLQSTLFNYTAQSGTLLMTNDVCRETIGGRRRVSTLRGGFGTKSGLRTAFKGPGRNATLGSLTAAAGRTHGRSASDAVIQALSDMGTMIRSEAL